MKQLIFRPFLWLSFSLLFCYLVTTLLPCLRPSFYAFTFRLGWGWLFWESVFILFPDLVCSVVKESAGVNCAAS